MLLGESLEIFEGRPKTPVCDFIQTKTHIVENTNEIVARTSYA